MLSSVASNPDPFVFVEDGTNPGNHDTNSKALFTGSMSGALVLLIAGQSNTCNSFPTPYTPTNTTVYNLNIYDGAIYKAVDPLLGCSNVTIAGNFGGRLADKIINAAIATKVLLVPVSIDGTAISRWSSQADLGGRMVVGLRRLSARGLAPSAILWGQGESDAGSTQAAYAASLTTTIGLSRTAGFTGPWFIAKQTMLSGVVNSAVQAAQVAAVDHPSGIWAGPDADSITTANRQDGTHFNDTGADLYAGLWQTALHAFGAPF